MSSSLPSGTRRAAGVAVLLALVLGAALLGLSHEHGAAVRRQVPSVHAERAGLRLGTDALTGRVALVSSVARVRWRIVGLTGWARSDGYALLRGWDTTNVADGTYALELRAAGRATTQPLVVRNSTPLPASELANASAGLDTRQNDGRAVVARFTRRSYRPGDVAALELSSRYPGLVVQVLRVGPKNKQAARDTLSGLPTGPPRRVSGAPHTVRVRIGTWESGVYAAALRSQGKLGFAVFVVRPKRLGENRVAVVQPTNSWQAYNYRCADGDGVSDTWYATTACSAVDVRRPYLDRGVPPHFRTYDLGFLTWLWREGKHVDMLAQEDLEHLSGDRLAQLYDLIVFPGHHEYVTTAEYDAVQRFRDLGGNLAFLSANNFFSRVDRRGDWLVRIGRWRDLGRPEAALVGVQYFDWFRNRYDARQFTVVGAELAPWFVRGTGLRNGDGLGWWGIEIDGRTAASPRSTRVLARMANAFGRGRPAEMTYYETPRGARVFAAGAFTLGGDQAMGWTTGKVLENLWRKLAAPDQSLSAYLAWTST